MERCESDRDSPSAITHNIWHFWNWSVCILGVVIWLKIQRNASCLRCNMFSLYSIANGVFLCSLDLAEGKTDIFVTSFIVWMWTTCIKTRMLLNITHNESEFLNKSLLRGVSVQGNLYLLWTENNLKSADFVMSEYEILLDHTLKVKAYIWNRKGFFLLNIVSQHVCF